MPLPDDSPWRRVHQYVQATETEQRQTEKMQALGQLVAGVAHEINTPLGALTSNLDLLHRTADRLATELDRDAPDVEQLRKLVGHLPQLLNVSTDAADRLRQICDSLRRFARLDQASRDLADLHEGLDSTLTLVEYQTRGRIAVVRDYGDLPRVDCRPNELNQVFMNLLVNAIQAIDEEGTVTVRTRLDGDHVTVAIADTGKGIPDDLQARIFDPGFTTKGVGVGTGLGLAISHRIIQDHRGKIEVESAVGHGTTFRIRLPISQPDAER